MDAEPGAARCALRDCWCRKYERRRAHGRARHVSHWRSCGRYGVASVARTGRRSGSRMRCSRSPDARHWLGKRFAYCRWGSRVCRDAFGGKPECGSRRRQSRDCSGRCHQSVGCRSCVRGGPCWLRIRRGHSRNHWWRRHHECRRLCGRFLYGGRVVEVRLA